MSDKRKQQSIRAARDWLDEADASLSSGSGLKGDLKVMLAKAELRRAEEAEPPTRAALWRRRALRILPLTAAAVIVALAWFLTPAVAPPETAGIPSRPAELVTPAQTGERTEPEATQESAARPDPSPLAQETSVPSETAMQTEQETGAASVPMVTENAAQPAQTAAALPKEQDVQPPAPAIPAPETQKLMQSAGKVLRQP